MKGTISKVNDTPRGGPSGGFQASYRQGPEAFATEQRGIARAVALKEACAFYGRSAVVEDAADRVLKIADQFFAWLTDGAAPGPDLAIDEDFLPVWDNAVEGRGLDQKTGRSVLAGMCKKRGIDFAAAGVAARAKLLDDLRAATRDQIEQVKAAAKRNGSHPPASGPEGPQRPPLAAPDPPAAVAAPPPEQQLDELVGREWPAFLAGWHRLVAGQVAEADFRHGIDRAVATLARRARPESISRTTRLAWVRASLEGRFDFLSGRIITHAGAGADTSRSPA